MTYRFLLGLLVACCQAWAWALPHGSQQADLRRLSCDGPLRPDASAATLAEYFGYKNLADADIYVGEGYTEEATVVFGDSPSDRLEVFWKDKAARSGPLRVVVRQTTTGFPMSRWRTPAGLTLGMRLRDIERRNGRPFRLSGFGWDYDGTVLSWADGRFQSDQPSGCRDRARLAVDEVLDDSQRRLSGQVNGDHEFSSGHPAMHALDPYVTEVWLDYGRAR
jgi:hypothetical protein